MRAILTYHSVDHSGSAISVSPETFRGHVEWLASGAVPVLGVEALARAPADTAGVAITFDDGFENFAERAWPLLRDRGLPATLFVVADRVGGRNDWGHDASLGVPDLPLLGWEALGGLREDGVSIQSHGRSHRPLSGMSAPELEDEVTGSAEVLERRLGVRPTGFAYPYGEADARGRSAVADAYDWACTTELRPLEPAEQMHALPRLEARYFDDPDALRSWGSRAFRLKLRVRRGGRGVRRALSGPAWGS